MTSHSGDEPRLPLTDEECERLLAQPSAAGGSAVSAFLQELAELRTAPAGQPLPGADAALTAFREHRQTSAPVHHRFTARLAALGTGVGVLVAAGAAAAATGHLPDEIRHVFTGHHDSPAAPAEPPAPASGHQGGSNGRSAAPPTATTVPGAPASTAPGGHGHGHGATPGSPVLPTPGHDQGNGKSRSQTKPGRTTNHGKHKGTAQPKPHPTHSPKAHGKHVPPSGNPNGHGNGNSTASVAPHGHGH